ncbi:pentapeptide repeat-containing protein [Thalassococcus sp. BH17M4-6]|uniref:pentapeptide repeat-containing protein n=1 Tax=Thalassococcus sp. BH17M4-6 TaxID=3413148 RepID=UPI003BC3245B
MTSLRTTGRLAQSDPLWPGAVHANLTGKALATKPADWRPRVTARRIYFSEWCKRFDTPTCPETVAEAERLLVRQDFNDEFDDLRRDYIAALPTTSFSGRDLRQAEMADAFAPGVSFAGADLTGAKLDRALLELATLTDVTLAETDFTDAKLPATQITGGTAHTVDFSLANLSQSRIAFDHLNGADFSGANLADTRLSGRVTGLFTDAPRQALSLRGADLSGLRIENSLITPSEDPDALRGVNILGLDAYNGTVSPVPGRQLRLDGTALRWIDLSAVYLPVDAETLPFETWPRVFANSFGDRSVTLPPGARYPCQWLQEIRPGFRKFFGTWRAWLEKGGRPWPPMPEVGRLTDVEATSDGGTDEFTLDTVEALPENIPENCDWK